MGLTEFFGAGVRWLVCALHVIVGGNVELRG